MQRLAPLALAAALLAAGPALGQDDIDELLPFEGGQILYPGGLFFVTLDADNDYEITSAERTAGYAAAFARADRDGSGDLAPLEYADFAERALGSRDALPGMVTLDRDHSGRVSRAEFTAGYEQMAERYVRAGDAVITFAALVIDSEEIRAVISDRRRLAAQREAARERARRRPYPQ